MRSSRLRISSNSSGVSSTSPNAGTSRHSITPFKLTFNVLQHQSEEFREIADANPASVSYTHLEVDEVTLSRVAVNSADLMEGMKIKGVLGRFFLQSHGVDLSNELAVICLLYTSITP